MRKDLRELKKKFDTKKIELRKSNIKNAGYGVFAKCDMPSKTKLGEYLGEMIDDDEASKRDNKVYFFRVMHKDGSSHIIDALPNEHANIMKYVNGVRTPQQRKRQNCEAYQYNNKIYYRTICDVKAGDELLVDYGPTYWLKEDDLRLLQELFQE